MQTPVASPLRHLGLRIASLPLLLAGTLGGTASAQWVTFQKETSTRLQAATSLIVNDNVEKDFAVGDLNKDGWDDLVVGRKFPGSMQGGFRNILFMNENGVLVDRTTEYASQSDVGGDQGFLAKTNDRDVEIADVDGDGWLDVVTATTMSDQVTAVLGQPRVYRNLGNNGQGQWLGLKFEDARIPVLKAANGSTANPRFCDMVLGDVTGDGKPDIFFTDYDTPETSGTVCIDLNQDGDTSDADECQQSPAETSSLDYQNKLLINDGNGNFTDSTTTRMTSAQLASAFGNATIHEDMNGDGLKDIVRINTLTSGQNVGILRPTSAAGTSWSGPDVAYSGAPYNMAPADLNLDGKMDLVVVDDSQDRFLINTSSGSGVATFTSYTIADSLSEFGNSVCVTKNGRLPDFDNDGYPDAIITDVDADLPPFCPSTGRRTHIYHNRFPTTGLGSGMLDEEGQVIPNADLQNGFDAAAIDIDKDGWLDLVLGRCSGIDVWMNKPPVDLVFSYPGGTPTTLDPGTPTNVLVQTSIVGGGSIVAGTALVHWSVDGGSYQAATMNSLGGGLYQAVLPAFACGSTIDYYFSGDLSNGPVINDPETAPAATYSALVVDSISTLVNEAFEGTVTGWTVSNTALTAGAWEIAVPNGTANNGAPAAPSGDASPSGTKAWVTLNGSPGGTAGASDLDGGPTQLTSPTFSLAAGDGIVSYARWFYCDDAGATGADSLIVEISNNNGGSWTTLETVTTNAGAWTTSSFLASDFLAPTSTMKLRFTVSDNPNNSVTEAGLDDLKVEVLVCAPDTDGDGVPDASDNCPSTPNANQADSDSDGVGNACDGCPNDPNKVAPGTCGCGVADTDSDGDGTPNCNDGCPNDPAKTSPGTCGCGVADTDSDGDGTPNCNDGCPSDPAKIAPGTCGCGVADTDSDGDGTPNCNDGCPSDPAKTAPGSCGCGVSDADSDGDGTPNCADACPNDPAKIAPGACGCGVADTDSDGDGTPNCNDGCPNDPAKTAPGTCGCGVADTDSDGDGTPNCNDGCPNDPAKTAPGTCGCGNLDTQASYWPDVDGDGFGQNGATATLACVSAPPAGMVTNDADCNDADPSIRPGATELCNTIDDDCDGQTDEGFPDSDADGTLDCFDGCPNDPAKTAPGTCGCGVADVDTDGDGTFDCNDGCPTDPAKVAPGTCGCGVADSDTDGDGAFDCNDGCPSDPAKVAPGTCGCGVADTDTDGDGTADCNDGCPADPVKVAPGTCGCGISDADGDGDGQPDCGDACPEDPNKSEPGICGCGTPDTDSDGDGTADCVDDCPSDPAKTAPGSCGCGVSDTDSDGDGTADCNDGCPDDPTKTAPGTCGCGNLDTQASYWPDVDGDGFGQSGATAIQACVSAPPAGMVTNDADCNDADPSIRPGATELCNTIDDDCDGQTDEGFPDSDADGTLDCFDGCPNDPAKTAPGTCGCGVADVDTDGDGTFDCNDGCPTDPAKVAPGTCGCGVADSDTDGDGAFDCNDGCPSDPAKVAPGTCGCGVSDADGDGDGQPDCGDACPEDPNKSEPGICGCGVPDTDSDGDGTADCNDGCPADPAKTAPGTCGCGTSDRPVAYWPDVDGDGFGDSFSAETMACEGAGPPGFVTNALDCDDASDAVFPGATEACNGIDDDCDGDADEGFPDGDADGTVDCLDGCPEDPAKTDPGTCGCGTADTDGDGDGTADCNDGCPSDPAKTAPGLCGCGVTDTDTDGDGTPNCNDGCPDDPAKIEPGACGCGSPDVDTDSDGVADCKDGCPEDPSKSAPGACGCGVPEIDSDGDGWIDCIEGCPGDPSKTDPGLCGCGVPDTDTDGDGMPDCIDLCPTDPLKIEPGTCGCGAADDDGDGDGAADCDDLCPDDPAKTDPGICGCGTPDDDGDGDVIPDCLDACAGYPDDLDCNGNGVADGCDIHEDGTSLDVNANEVPDECECITDLEGDGDTDGGDLGLLLALWGGPGPADFNGDGVVNGADLGQLLASWGGCDVEP